MRGNGLAAVGTRFPFGEMEIFWNEMVMMAEQHRGFIKCRRIVQMGKLNFVCGGLCHKLANPSEA